MYEENNDNNHNNGSILHHQSSIGVRRCRLPVSVIQLFPNYPWCGQLTYSFPQTELTKGWKTHLGFIVCPGLNLGSMRRIQSQTHHRQSQQHGIFYKVVVVQHIYISNIMRILKQNNIHQLPKVAYSMPIGLFLNNTKLFSLEKKCSEK